MDKDVAISVKNVTMSFNLNKEKVDNLKEYAIKLLTRRLEYKKFNALKDISFEVKKGERLAILGFNGAGKSTLLKTIVGVYKPTTGTVERSGVIAPLLELGAGFDPNYSGKENIYLYGAILGYSREYIDSKYKEIVSFSELGHFINVPLKNYSSGMKARLGFSIATAVQPDVLILDEVLSVGDAKFREKSLKKVQGMFDSGVTVLFVSHNISQVKRICDKAILLNHGKIIAKGDVNDVSALYESLTKLDRNNKKLLNREISKFKIAQRKKQLANEAKSGASYDADEVAMPIVAEATVPKPPVKQYPLQREKGEIKEKAAAKPVEQAAEKPIQKPVEIAAEKPVEKPAEVVAEKVTEKPVEKPKVSAEVQTAEQIVAETVKASSEKKSATDKNQSQIYVPMDYFRKESTAKPSNTFVDVFSSSQTASTNNTVENDTVEEEAPKPQSRASIQFANMQNRIIQPNDRPPVKRSAGMGRDELDEIIKNFSR